MESFEDLTISKPLKNAIDDMGFSTPTPIQQKAFPVILSGRDVIGIAQTGTGKTFAYMLPILQQLKFSKQIHPRVLILQPTRELVMQVVANIEKYAAYMNVRVFGVYGETNISPQKEALTNGVDILVATPGRLYDLVVNRALQLKEVKKLVIDEVDVMLDLGFRLQLSNIFDLLPTRRQNMLFSATMTQEIAVLMKDFLTIPEKITIAVSGTPLENIQQRCYHVKNFYTKVNLLKHLLADRQIFHKVLLFVATKKVADRLFECLNDEFGTSLGIIHSNKSQNYRIKSVEEFDTGEKRILIATDVISRGLDLNKISHVISMDVPTFPENYMHRIGRTGRAGEKGKSILLFTDKEEADKLKIESLMGISIALKSFPEEVVISNQLAPEERTKVVESNHNRNVRKKMVKPVLEEKKEKNKKVNLGGSYKRKLEAKHKKPITRGDKNKNRRRK